MKKTVIFLGLIVFCLASLKVALPQLSLAQSSEVLLFGPHLTCNNSAETFKAVRQAYGNPSEWIPATVMISTNYTAQQITDIFEAARSNRIYPIIRLCTAYGGIWAPFDVSLAQEAAAKFKTAAGAGALDGFPRKVYIAFGNEPNLSREWGGMTNPEEYSAALAAFIQASAGAPYGILNGAMDISNPTGTIDGEYMIDALEFWAQIPNTIVRSLNGWAFNPYELKNDDYYPTIDPSRYNIHAWQVERDWLRDNKDPGAAGKPTFLVEFGPAPVGGRGVPANSKTANFLAKAYQNAQDYKDKGVKAITPLILDGHKFVVFRNGAVSFATPRGGLGCGGTIIFEPGREETTDDLTASISDPVRLVQEDSLSYPEREKTIARAGIFRNFHNLGLPFAQGLAQYLAGPFLYQGNTQIAEVLQELKEEEKMDNLGVLVKLTPRDLQDELRRDYRKKCKDGTYCSNTNIPSEKCPDASYNECLISDGTSIQKIEPPPEPSNYTNQEAYWRDYNDWAERYLAQWVEIPLVANPLTRVEEAISHESCPDPDEKETTVVTKTPWVSALRDTANILHQLLTPVIPQTTSQRSYFDVKGETASCPAPSVPDFVRAKATDTVDEIMVEGEVTGEEAETRLYGPEVKLECDWKAIYEPAPGAPAYCPSPCDPATAPPECGCAFSRWGCVGKEGHEFNDPVWAEVKFPFLETIYNRLSGPQGVFRIFKPKEVESHDWDWAGESKLNYCLDFYSPGYKNALTSGTLEKYEIDPPPPGTCPDNPTANLRVFPRFIGGVQKAMEWVKSLLLPRGE